jgi:hypothetical protein
MSNLIALDGLETGFKAKEGVIVRDKPSDDDNGIKVDWYRDGLEPA